MMSLTTHKNPKNSDPSAATRETVTTPPGSNPSRDTDDASELASTADAASEATEIGAAVALGGIEPDAPTGPAGTLEGATGQIRSANENLLATVKLTGNLAIDTYENALCAFLTLEEQIGALSGPGLIGELTRAHVSMVASVSRPMFSTAREVLR
ncbi:hypothetical protein [Rhodococcus chondri]|uniref:Phasin domain-containing protein n=1 Tax=Rhodococcus chondri TaxID=3065941 RepID=A0ABU7JR99_9NOCA|nr:hypothetical protein [Rhodococcus sp. CC-R104]MEE2032548.1 hypothetical protein [Rhodococcus sp. CC-R104]